MNLGNVRSSPEGDILSRREICRYGPRLCENVRARERRRIVFSIVFSRLLSSAFFVFQIDDVEMKFLSANSISEFSHGLGHSLPLRPGPVSHQVRRGLEADVTAMGWNGKTGTLSRAILVPLSQKWAPLRQRHRSRS
jgi:hypothetical protein